MTVQLCIFPVVINKTELHKRLVGKTPKLSLVWSELYFLSVNPLVPALTARSIFILQISWLGDHKLIRLQDGMYYADKPG